MILFIFFDPDPTGDELIKIAELLNEHGINLSFSTKDALLMESIEANSKGSRSASDPLTATTDGGSATR